MPGRAKVLGSRLARICFFFSNGKYSVSKKLSANYVCFSTSIFNVLVVDLRLIL